MAAVTLFFSTQTVYVPCHHPTNPAYIRAELLSIQTPHAAFIAATADVYGQTDTHRETDLVVTAS